MKALVRNDGCAALALPAPKTRIDGMQREFVPIAPGAVIEIPPAYLVDLLEVRGMRARYHAAELVVLDAGGATLPPLVSPSENEQTAAHLRWKRARQGAWTGAGGAEQRRRDEAAFWATRAHWTGDWAKRARAESAERSAA